MSTSSVPLPPVLEKSVRRLQQTTDPKRRYEYLLWLAKRLPAISEDLKTSENKVPGCVSQVFVIAALMDGKVTFQADSDAQLTKGLVALLVEGLNGLTPQEISQLTPDFIKDTGLDVSLTPSRANGFYNIFQAMQRKALLCQLEMSMQSADNLDNSSQ